MIIAWRISHLPFISGYVSCARMTIVYLVLLSLRVVCAVDDRLVIVDSTQVSRMRYARGASSHVVIPIKLTVWNVRVQQLSDGYWRQSRRYLLPRNLIYPWNAASTPAPGMQQRPAIGMSDPKKHLYIGKGCSALPNQTLYPRSLLVTLALELCFLQFNQRSLRIFSIATHLVNKRNDVLEWRPCLTGLGCHDRCARQSRWRPNSVLPIPGQRLAICGMLR